MYVCVYVYMHICTYIYRERERERGREFTIRRDRRRLPRKRQVLCNNLMTKNILNGVHKYAVLSVSIVLAGPW